MADISTMDAVTVDELDVAGASDATDSSKLLLETDDGKMKSVSKVNLFSSEATLREATDTLLQNQITSLAGDSGVVEKLNLSLKGAVNGVAELDENGKVPSSQLPSYVDDVIEGYYNSTDGKFYNEYSPASVTHDIWSDGTNFINSDLSSGTQPAGVPGTSVDLGIARKYLTDYYVLDNDLWYEVTTLSTSTMTHAAEEETDATVIAALQAANDLVLSYIPYIEDTGTYSSEIIGETGKIYTDKRTNLTYRWGGSVYASLSSDLALGTTSNTAFRGDYGKRAYDHSLVRGTGAVTNNNPHGLSKVDIGLGNVPNVTTNDQAPTINDVQTLETLDAGDTLSVIVSKVKKAISSLITHIADTGNPHSVTKSQVGLGDVVNTGDSSVPVSGGATKFTTGGAYTELGKKQDRDISSTLSWASTVEGGLSTLYSDKNDKVTVTNDSSTALGDSDTLLSASAGTNPTAMTGHTILKVWTYIQSKISSVLGLTQSAYGGKASTAGTADYADKITTSAGIGNITIPIYVDTDGTVKACTDISPSVIDMTNAINTLSVSHGGTGATTAADARTNLGIDTELANKVDKVSGKGLSTNDFTTTLLNKLNGIESGAQVNTVTGVKGNSERSYRTGNVNITKANIGLSNVDNTADANKNVNYATSAGYANNSDAVDGYHVSTTSGTTQNNSLNALVPVEKQYFTTSGGYIKYSNGLLIQWGRVAYPRTDTIVTFPIQYTSNLSYSILLSGAASDHPAYYYTYEPDHMTINISNNNSEICWMTIGY